MQNVVNYVVKKNSDLCMVILDVSAAFDRINLFGMLSKLLEKEYSFKRIRVLLSSCRASHACVRSNDVCSDFFVFEVVLNKGK